MASSTRLSVWVALAAVAVWCYLNFVTILEATAGRITIDPARLQRWENLPDVANGACVVDTVANACEDVNVHAASSTAFLACGDPAGRVQWFPSSRFQLASNRATFREQFFKFDLKTNTRTELKLDMNGLLPDDHDIVTHGLDIFPAGEKKDDKKNDKILVFAVNHARSGDAILIFEHTLGTDVLRLVREVRHPAIKSANSVAAIGPRSFYITNDHYYPRGVLRLLEDRFGPWAWATSVQYCSAEEGAAVVCKEVSETMPCANGLAVSKDNLVFAGDSKNGSVTVYEMADGKPDQLRRVRVVDVGAIADNIKILAGTGDPLVTVFPDGEELPLFLANVSALGRTVFAPTAVLRLRKERDFEPELLLRDNGAQLTDMTAADIDPKTRTLVGASFLKYGGFAVCKLPDSVDLS
ncbi:hypothetical protein SCUCBS95973_006489 [Sporothrix curviconia]|uniref:Paraoxonase n=1 Tax=Sporothrix curviconia TaxID=1260050 RepID=A0ABP0C5K3_9PEZI